MSRVSRNATENRHSIWPILFALWLRSNDRRLLHGLEGMLMIRSSSFSPKTFSGVDVGGWNGCRRIKSNILRTRGSCFPKREHATLRCAHAARETEEDGPKKSRENGRKASRRRTVLRKAASSTVPAPLSIKRSRVGETQRNFPQDSNLRQKGEWCEC